LGVNNQLFSYILNIGGGGKKKNEALSKKKTKIVKDEKKRDSEKGLKNTEAKSKVWGVDKSEGQKKKKVNGHEKGGATESIKSGGKNRKHISAKLGKEGEDTRHGKGVFRIEKREKLVPGGGCYYFGGGGGGKKKSLTEGVAQPKKHSTFFSPKKG